MIDDHRTYAQKIIRGGVVITLFSLLASPLGYLIRLMLSRSLTIEEYGLFYSLLGFVGIFAVFNDLGFGYSVAYFIPKFLVQRQFQKVWNTYFYDQIIELTTSLILSIILLASSEWLAVNYFKMPEAQSLLFVFSLYFVANSVVSALQKFFTGIQKEKYYSSMEFFRLLITSVLIFILWLQGLTDISYYAWSWVAGYAVVAFLYMLIQRLEFRYSVKRLHWDKQLFLTMFQYAIPTLLLTSVAIISGYIDTFVLTLLRGVREVGVYNVVFPLAAISSFLFSPIQALFLPLISQHHKDNPNIVSIIINKLLFVIPLLGIYVCFFIFLFTDAVIGILFGNQWIASSSLPLKLLSTFYSFSLMSMFLATIISGLGKISERFKIVIGIFVFHLGISIILTYTFGVFGTVVANSVVYILLSSLYIRTIRQEVPITLPWRSYFKTIGLVTALAGMFLWFNFTPETFIQLLNVGILYSTLFGIGTFLVHRTECFAIVRLVNSLIQKKQF